MTSLIYEERGTLCREIEAVVLLWPTVVKMNANFFSCTSSEYELRMLSMENIFEKIGSKHYIPNTILSVQLPGNTTDKV